MERFYGFCRSICKRETFTVKHFYLVLKMAGHGPGSSLKNSCDLFSSLGKVPGIMLPFQNYTHTHDSNMPDKINNAIQLFPNDVAIANDLDK